MSSFDSNIVHADPDQRFTLNISLANGVFTWSVIARVYVNGQEQTGNVTRNSIYGLTVNVGGNTYYKGDIAWGNYLAGATVYSGTTSLANCSISNGAVPISLSGNFYYGTWNTDYKASISNSIPVASPTVATPTYTAGNTYSSKIVGGFSTLTFSFSATAGTSGNTISNYKLFQDGVQVYSGATNSCTITAPLVGTHSFYVMATESNGATGNSSAISINTVEYVYPSFTNLSSIRWSTDDSSGNADDAGEYARLSATYENSSIDGTDLTTYCRVSVSTFSDILSASGDVTYTTGIISADSSYIVIYELYDSFIGQSNAVVRADTISIGGRGVDVVHGQNDYGLAVGMKATEGQTDSAYPIGVCEVDVDGTILNKAEMTATPTDTSITITRTSGWTIKSKKLYVWGRVAQLSITFNASGSLNVGANVFVGSIADYLPKGSVMGVGYWDTAIYTGWIDTSGAINIRLSGYAQSYSFSGDATISFTYLF